jgi:hypothetical protein
MADYNVGQYVLEVWKSNHTGHTITRVNSMSGGIRYNCSCGNSLLIDEDKRSATDALALPAKISG